jgi:hypothetical protein
MDVNAIINAIDSQLQDQAQRERIKDLAERIQKAFSSQRSKGIESELNKDWEQFEGEFDSKLDQVKKLTGLY